MNCAATTTLHGTNRASSRAAGALLLVDLACRAASLAAVLGLVCACLTSGELPQNHPASITHAMFSSTAIEIEIDPTRSFVRSLAHAVPVNKIRAHRRQEDARIKSRRADLLASERQYRHLDGGRRAGRQRHLRDRALGSTRDGGC